LTGARSSGSWSWLTVGMTIVIVLVFQQFADVFATIPAVLLYQAHSGQQLLGGDGGTHAIAGLITALTGMVSAFVLLPFVWLVARSREPKVLRFLGYVRCRPRVCAIWVAGGALLFIAALGGGEVARDVPPTISSEHLRSTAVWPWLLLVSVGAVFPLLEETIYRGFLVGALQRMDWVRVPIVIASAFAWTLAHGQYGGYDMIVLFCLGLTLAAARVRTDSIVPPLLIHSAWNVAVFMNSA